MAPLKDWQIQFIERETAKGVNAKQLLDSMGIDEDDQPPGLPAYNTKVWADPAAGLGWITPAEPGFVIPQAIGSISPDSAFSWHGLADPARRAQLGWPEAATPVDANYVTRNVPNPMQQYHAPTQTYIGGGQGGGQGQDFIGGAPPSGWTENYGDPRRSGVDLYLGRWSEDPNKVIGQEWAGSPLGHVNVSSGADPRTSPNYNPPSGPTGPTGPTGPVDPSADPRLWTSPMPGYIQFTPGGAIYEWNPSVDPAVLQAQQHTLTPMGGMEWARRFGTDPYVPGIRNMVMGGIVPDAGTNVYSNIAEWQRQSPGQWRGGQYYPSNSELQMQNDMRIENATNALYARQMELARQMGYSFSGAPATGGYGGQGYSGPAYDPFGGWNAPQGGGTFASGIPAAPVGYPDIPAVPAGEPSFSGDPILDDASLDINTLGLEALSIPARTRLTQWLRDDMGFDAQGVLSSAGETSWQRPEGESGNIAFSAADYAKITDPTLRAWIQWLMGKMGYSTPTKYPLAAA